MTTKRIIYVTVLIPTLIIILLAACRLWYLQRVYPRQDFVYVASTYDCMEQVIHFLFPQLPSPHRRISSPENCDGPQLCVYHFKTQTSTPMTMVQAEKLNLSPQQISVDGFKISPSVRYNGFDIWPFGGAIFQEDFLVSRGNQQRKLHLTTINNNNHNIYLQFIAWMPESANDTK
jgi:hypothetical protein